MLCHLGIGQPRFLVQPHCFQFGRHRVMCHPFDSCHMKSTSCFYYRMRCFLFLSIYRGSVQLSPGFFMRWISGDWGNCSIKIPLTPLLEEYPGGQSNLRDVCLFWCVGYCRGTLGWTEKTKPDTRFIPVSGKSHLRKHHLLRFDRTIPVAPKPPRITPTKLMV